MCYNALVVSLAETAPMQAMVAGILLCAGVQAAPVKVSVAGQVIEAAARMESAAIVGRVLPLINALGGTGEPSSDQRALTGRTFAGKPFEAEVGATIFTVGERTQGLSAPLRIEEGQLVGPLADMATALGARAWYAKSAGELRIAPRLAQVEAYAAEEGVLIHVMVTGPSAAHLEHLASPPKAYADFPGLTWTGGSESIQVGGTGGVRSIRWALFQEWPPIARVVLDLVPGTQVRLLPVRDGLFTLTTRAPQPEAPIEAKAPAPEARPEPLVGLHVVLDPARGGDDVGTQGSGANEKTVALDIALRAARLLMDAGALVSLTRDGDMAVSLAERAELIHALAPDAVVRIACGAPGGMAGQGLRTLYAEERDAPLALVLQTALVRKTGARDLKTALAPDARLVRGIPTAAVIVGSLSSPAEGKLLASAEYRAKIAAAIVEGLAGYARSMAAAP